MQCNVVRLWGMIPWVFFLSNFALGNLPWLILAWVFLHWGEKPIRVSKFYHFTVVGWHKILLTLRKILVFVLANYKIHDFFHFPNLFF